MPVYACFTYPADMAPGAVNRNAAWRALRDDNRSTPGYPCFAYPGDIPLGNGNHGAAQPGPEGRPDFVAHMCFSCPSGHSFF